MEGLSGFARRAGGCLLAGGLGALLVGLPARGARTEPRPIPVVDLHVDLPYQFGYRAQSFAAGSGQFPASELLRAGVVGVVLPLFVPAKVSPSGPRMADLEASYERVLGALARTEPYQAPGCAARGSKVRTWLAFEGAGPLAEHPEQLSVWAERGLRSVGLVHTRKNALASSSGDPEPQPEGLSERGRALVRRALELSLPIDVSHASARTTREVTELSREAGVPVLATHSDSRKLRDVARNLDDAELAAIAATGGVVGVNFHSPYLVPQGRATLTDVVNHVRHLVRVAGIDHVGIGSDFEGDIRPPSGLGDVRAFPKLARALEAAGFSRAAVTRIFSGNALRVLCPQSARAEPESSR